MHILGNNAKCAEYADYEEYADARYAESPSDPCLTDLDRILTEGQDPGAQQYLVLGTVPIKGKNLGFWVPMHFLY